MAKRTRKEPERPANGRPPDSFRWPSRQAAHASERAAAAAAELGLKRLRARSARNEAAPVPEPPPAPASPDPEPQEAEAEPAPLEEPESQPPAPELWEAEFDRLAEKLVRGLRQDLGPADR